jgi:predicted nucleic-acid-binding protein
MIGLDTNVLVRFFVQDDAIQARQVDTLMQSLSPESPAFVSSAVLAELAWVLRRYGVDKAQLCKHLNTLLDSPEIIIESDAALRQAIPHFALEGGDFADRLIERICSVAGCSRTLTFDVKAAKSSGMELLRP